MRNELVNKLPADLKALYLLTRHDKLPTLALRQYVQTEISEARRRSNGVDLLAQKALEIRVHGGVQMYQKKLKTLNQKLYQITKPLPLTLEPLRGSPEESLAKEVAQDPDARPYSDVLLGELRTVEIECLFLNRADETRFANLIRKAKMLDYVTIKDDGSLRTTAGKGGYSREIVVTFSYVRWDILEAVCHALKLVGAYVNKTCGLHVHFDARHMTKLRVAKRANRIARCVPALKMLLPPSRANNQYCAHTKNTFSGTDRYAFVNVQAYNKYQTLEIRGHSGTINFLKIKNWIRLLDIIAKTHSTIKIADPLVLVTRFNLPKDLAQFVVTRAAKFSKSTLAVDDVALDEEESA